MLSNCVINHALDLALFNFVLRNPFSILSRTHWGVGKQLIAYGVCNNYFLRVSLLHLPVLRTLDLGLAGVWPKPKTNDFI